MVQGIQPCKRAAIVLFIQGHQTQPILIIYETKLALECLDSRYTGAEDFAFTGQTAENSNAYYNTALLHACACAYANKDQWIFQIMKSRMLTQNDIHLWTYNRG